jgi:hypothetical protein
LSRTDWRFPRRKQRREEAAERQAYHDTLSTEDKIAVAKSRRGNSAKEIARLEAQLGN